MIYVRFILRLGGVRWYLLRIGGQTIYSPSPWPSLPRLEFLISVLARDGAFHHRFPNRMMAMRKIPFLILLMIGAPLAAQTEPQVIPGATETTPSRSQYFSWINNRNDGATESQTLANLEFFKWLHDEYGMKLDIYAFDAGIIDGPKYYGSLDSRKFKSQFPRGLDPIYQLAKSFDCRLGVWLGPDGYGDTPEQETARREMLVKLCRDYHFALFKMDAVCTQLRPEKRDAFAKTMIECRKYSPDLILLNHRLDLGHATPHATTFLWGGEETYIDVHMTNRRRTGTHSRVEAMSRGLVPNLQRLTEDHGVCISSCLDFWEDDLVLQAFNRNLILAPSTSTASHSSCISRATRFIPTRSVTETLYVRHLRPNASTFSFTCAARSSLE